MNRSHNWQTAEASRPALAKLAGRTIVRTTCRTLLCAMSVMLGSNLLQAAQAQPAGPFWANSLNVQSNGGFQQTPRDRSFSRASGLSLKVDSRWANNYGYRPIEVVFTASKPTTADHLITVRLYAGWLRFARGSVVVEQDLEMLQGSTTATVSIAFPQYQLEPQYFWWEVWVDGVKDRELSIDQAAARSVMAAAIMPTVSNAISILMVGPIGQQRWLTAPNTQEFEVLSLPAVEFPSRWIGYTCFDVVSLSLAEIQGLAQSNSPAFAALMQWARAGGQIWISDAGKEFERLDDISKLLGVSESVAGTTDEPAATTDKDDAAFTATPAAWQPARIGRRSRTGEVVTFLDLRTQTQQVARDAETINRLQNDPNFAAVARQFEANPREPGRRLPRNSGEWFVDQQLGLGTVRAFRESQATVLSPSARPLPTRNVPSTGEEGGRRQTSALSLALRATPRWDARHGMTPDDANPDFANFLVPGVGLAPVTEFRVLITLFVLLIGPVNYWLLKRSGRLHLLVLTVPLAAVLMTSALFGYAILSDGFGTTVRAQSLTTLDQRTGEAACWSRLSYYSGLAPGDGLTMPSDVAVYPIIPGWNDPNIDANIGGGREILWGVNDARLKQGWLRSRTPTQYLTVRARKSPHRIELTPAGDTLRATNVLGTTIHYLLVVADDDRLFAAENVRDSSTTQLAATDRVLAIKRLRQLVSDNEPEAPPALATEESELLMLQRRQTRHMMRNRFGLQYSDERLNRNLLYRTLTELVGLSGQPALQLPPHSYVAVTESGPEVAVGLPGAEEEASFHVIIGRW